MIMLGMIFSLGAYYMFENEHNLLFKSFPFIIGILILTYIFFLIRKSDYFYLEYIGNKIIIRYYRAHPFLRNYKAIEIQKVYFFDYEIKKSLLGLRRNLQIMVKTPKGKFKYPPLSISLLNKEQYLDLIKILDKLKQN
jgi:hypothetical protein